MYLIKRAIQTIREGCTINIEYLLCLIQERPSFSLSFQPGNAFPSKTHHHYLIYNYAKGVLPKVNTKPLAKIVSVVLCCLRIEINHFTTLSQSEPTHDLIKTNLKSIILFFLATLLQQ